MPVLSEPFAAVYEDRNRLGVIVARMGGGRLRGLRGRRSLPGPVSDPARSRCGDHHDAAVGRGALDLTVSNVVHPPSINRQHLRSNPT
jgi:hypothetical protein